MGAMPRLKIKDKVHYRKGHTNESQNCKACKHFKKAWVQFINNPNGPDVISHRCQIIGGLDKESIRYRVREDYTWGLDTKRRQHEY